MDAVHVNRIGVHRDVPNDGMSPGTFTVGAGLAAGLLGVVAAHSAQGAVLAVLGLAVLVLVAFRPLAVLGVLVATIGLESLSAGSVAVSRVIAPIALVVVVSRWQAEGPFRLPTLPTTWVVAYVVWALASGLWTDTGAGTATKLTSLAVALLYMVSFARLVNHARMLRRGLFVVALIAVFTGLATIGTFVGGGAGARGSGLVGDPNFFAAIQTVALPLVLVLASEVRARGWQLACYAGVLVIVASVVASLSRGGLLALGVVLLLVVALPSGAIFASRRQRAVVGLTIAATLTIALVVAAGQLLPRLSGPTLENGSGRQALWLAAGTARHEHPLLGLGYGAFPARSIDLMNTTPGVDFSVYVPPPGGEQAHSAYLSTAAELGWPGLVLYGGVLVSTGLALRRASVVARRRGRAFVSRISNATLLSLVGWSIASIFLSTEVSRPLWAIVGLSIALTRLATSADSDETADGVPAPVVAEAAS